MVDGHAAAPAEASAPAAGQADGPAPVQGDVRHANAGNAHDHTAPRSEKSSSPGRITPRPTFLENLADSRDSQFMLHRQDSDDLDRYFVSSSDPRDVKDDRTDDHLPASTAREISISIQNGPSCSVCMAVYRQN